MNNQWFKKIWNEKGYNYGYQIEIQMANQTTNFQNLRIVNRILLWIVKHITNKNGIFK